MVFSFNGEGTNEKTRWSVLKRVGLKRQARDNPSRQ